MSASSSASAQIYDCLRQTQRLRVSDGAIAPLLETCAPSQRLLVILWPQLGDFDSMEYAWWLQRQPERLAQAGVTVRAVGIGNRASGQRFCEFTGFDPDHLFMDSEAELHRQLDLYPGVTAKLPLLSSGQQAWLNLMLMCAGLGSPGTLGEVFRGYRGDRNAPQLIADDEVIKAKPLPPLKGSFFNWAGGSGFQRPFELATLRLRNMAEVLGNWGTYVPDASHLTQRGGTFLFDRLPENAAVDSPRPLLYEHRDPGILGFAANMSQPLDFLADLNLTDQPQPSPQPAS